MVTGAIAVGYSLSSEFGMQNFNQVLHSSESVTLNISAFDFLIVFNSLQPDMNVSEFRSYLSTSALDFYCNWTGTNPPLYLSMPIPFGQYQISSPLGGQLSFSYGSLAGLCKNGVIVTNSKFVDIELSSERPKPFSLLPNEEKCILFTAVGTQKLNIYTNCSGRFFIHPNLTSSEHHPCSGQSRNFSFDATAAPLLVRYVASSKRQNELFRVGMSCDGENPTVVWPPQFYQAHERPRITCGPADHCHLKDVIPLGLIGVGLVFVLLGILMIVSIVFIILRWRCPSYVRFSPIGTKPQAMEATEATPSSFSDDRAKVQGYFALDPILRSHIDGMDS
jgi:hypothetical protein